LPAFSAAALAASRLEARVHIGERERGHQVEEHISGEHNERAQDELAPAGLEDPGERQLGNLFGFEHLGEGGRFDQLEADVESDDDHDGADQERHTPTPRQELCGCQGVAEDEEDHVGDDEADGRPQLREGAVDGAFVGGGVFGGQQGCAAPFAAEGKSLGEAQHHQEGRCQEFPALHLRRRQAADQEGGNAHGQQRRHQGALAAELVTEVAKDDRAQGAGNESHTKDSEGAEQLGGLVLVGEEQRREDQHSGGRVDVEIVELHGGADQAGHNHAAA